MSMCALLARVSGIIDQGKFGFFFFSRDKVKPTAELERARCQIDWSKMAVKECLQYCDDAQGHIKNPTNHLKRSGGPLIHITACSKCEGTDSYGVGSSTTNHIALVVIFGIKDSCPLPKSSWTPLCAVRLNDG